jgi:hypothetical protein
MQFPYDTNHNGMLTSFSSICQNLTSDNMIFFGEFVFEILIFIVHYDYSFKMVLDYDMCHIQKLPHGKLIEFWKQIYIYTSK